MIIGVTERQYASLMRRIPEYSTPDGACIRWTGAFRTNKDVPRTPVLTVYVGGKQKRKLVNICKFLLEQHLARNLRAGFMACHSCGREWCVNRQHLYEGTAQSNANDCATHGSRARGERQGNSSITDGIAWAILLLTGMGHSYLRVANALGTTKRVVGTVAARQNWTHVESPVVV